MSAHPLVAGVDEKRAGWASLRLYLTGTNQLILRDEIQKQRLDTLGVPEPKNTSLVLKFHNPLTCL